MKTQNLKKSNENFSKKSTFSVEGKKDRGEKGDNLNELIFDYDSFF